MIYLKLTSNFASLEHKKDEYFSCFTMENYQKINHFLTHESHHSLIGA
jgi:hypothetical protein